MAVTNADSFLEVLEKSDLLTADELTRARELAGQTGDARTLARLLAQEGLISRWQAGQLLAGRSSFFLSKYKLIELLGRGGMGGVFLARHTMMNRTVALKIISRRIAKDPAALERFLAEARAIAALDDPNIVQAYNVDSEDGRYYIVMEYVEGQDLQCLVEEHGPLEFEQAVDFIRQAADGLAHAHSRNMVHCDIKPSNLLLNQQGVVKILDMGMARLSGPGAEDNGGSDERVLGTVDYLSPEQAVKSPDFDHRADIYSLGCTFFFLLTGKPPFGEGSLHERILKHQTKQPPNIGDLRPGTPKDLVAVCRKMMAKKPADRFQSAEEVSRLLSDWRPPKPKLRRATPLDEIKPPTDGGLPSINIATDGASSSGVRPAFAVSAASAATGGPNPMRRWLILGGVAGGLALVGLILVLVLLSSGGGNKPEPKPEPAHPVAKGHAREEDEFTAKPKVVGEFDPTKPAPGPGPAAKPPEKPNPEQPKPKPETKPAAKPQTKPEAKPQAKPETKPKPQTKPEEKPKPKPTPKPAPKPTPKPAPKPKNTDPFHELAAAVELPLLEDKAPPVAQATEPFLIGRVHVPDDTPWDLTLLGREHALKGTRQFLALEKGEVDGKASWPVQLEVTVPGRDTTKTPVARFWRDKTALNFQWLPGAEADTANHLRNCMLQVYLGGKTHSVTLSKPLEVPPLELDLGRGQVRTVIPLKWEPDPEYLRLEITGVEGQKTIKTEPKAPGSLKTPVVLHLMRMDRYNNEQKAVTIRVAARPLRTGLSLEARLVFPRVSVFRTKIAPGFRDMIENKQKDLQRQLDAKVKQNKISAEERSKYTRGIDALAEQLWYIDLSNSPAAGAKINFRVFTEIDKNKVELVKSQPGLAPKPKPAAKK